MAESKQPRRRGEVRESKTNKVKLARLRELRKELKSGNLYGARKKKAEQEARLLEKYLGVD